MAHREKLVVTAALLAVVLGSPLARADCDARTRLSPCFDADALWIPAAPSRFLSIPRSAAMASREFSVGFGVTYLSRPVVAKAMSPDPSGRTLLVVDDVVDASFAAAYAPARHVELGVVLPLALHRTGAGLTGISSQNGPPLVGTALRDVRLGVGHDLVLKQVEGSRYRFSAMSRLELALPTGNDDAFAGDRGPVLAPSFTLGLRAGPVSFGAQEGARLRRSSDFGGARLGTQLVTSVGVNVDVVGGGLFSISAEAWLLPNLLSTRREFPDGASVTAGAHVPAEWLASAWLRVSPLLIGLGGGTAIPLSSETRVSPEGVASTEHFAAVTSPRFRFALTARYAPRGD
jgi:hypothetical protein